ncbi:hypothetical protein GH810_02890 [Acetobacterium paludosum]|uniref:Uncharacterized protein n=1 Tax=Acetobacterium paludosum TaxID=52693 RepID=A0A923KV93_9FIRM|nr:hypothetical protein [Acetobacterium paludosum]MBC3887255.1 hypothetical protein [Acetobacterium paludosum]
MLKLIEGTKKDRPVVDYEIIYLNGMIKAIKAKQLEPENKDAAKQIVFYTMKYISVVELKDMTRERLEGLLLFNEMLLNTVCELTPADLITIFPINKTYDGARYQMKDYFTTMEALQDHGLNKPIQIKETASSLLWDYMNHTVMMYQVHCMSAISELHAIETGKGLMEQFFEEQGVKVGTFRKYENDTGQNFMIDEDGRSFPVTKKTPRYIKLVN